MNPKVISEEPMNMATLKAELERVQKRDGELNARANKTLEYINNSNTIKKKDAEELFNKINDLGIQRIKEIQIHKIVDLMPATAEELKSLLSGYNISLSSDNIKKILDAVAEYAPKK